MIHRQNKTEMGWIQLGTLKHTGTLDDNLAQDSEYMENKYGSKQRG